MSPTGVPQGSPTLGPCSPRRSRYTCWFGLGVCPRGCLKAEPSLWACWVAMLAIHVTLVPNVIVSTHVPEVLRIVVFYPVAV